MKTLITTVDLETGEMKDKGFYMDNVETSLIKFAKRLGYDHISVDIDSDFLLYFADLKNNLLVRAKASD